MYVHVKIKQNIYIYIYGIFMSPCYLVGLYSVPLLLHYVHFNTCSFRLWTPTKKYYIILHNVALLFSITLSVHFSHSYRSSNADECVTVCESMHGVVIIQC